MCSALPLRVLACRILQTVYNYSVLREALNIMSLPPAADNKNGSIGHELPLLLMRTVMISITTFPELKNFVATMVLPRLVQQKVRLDRCVLFLVVKYSQPSNGHDCA